MFASLNIPVDHNLIFALALLGTMAAVGLVFLVLHARMPERGPALLRYWLKVEAIVVAAGIVVLTISVFAPLFAGEKKTAENKLELPKYDYTPWYSFPVQVDGRVKPYSTAAIEAVRSITGREKFEEQPAVAVYLQWSLCPDGAPGKEFTEWEKKEFISCDHKGLREQIFAHLEPEEREKHKDGKHVAPADLRNSPGFHALIDSAAAKRKQDPEKAQHNMSPEERKAEEVAGRLVEFDAITQRPPDSARGQRQPDPLHFVALDRVASGGWFSLGQLRDMVQEPGDHPEKWMIVMYDRLARTPQLYIAKEPEQIAALEKFQQQIKDRAPKKALDELQQIMNEHSDRLVARFDELQQAGNNDGALRLFDEIARTKEDKERIFAVIRESKGGGQRDVLKVLRNVLEDQDREKLEGLRKRVDAAIAKGYRADDPQYRVIHLDYLEARYPYLYRDSLAAQKFPREQAEAVLLSYKQLVDAYQTNKPEEFSEKSQAFFARLQEVSERYTTYPGEDTVGDRLGGLFRGRPTQNPAPALLNLEMQFNKRMPFMWAWIVMLVAMVGFITSMAIQSRAAYVIAFGAYLVSLGFQLFGFFARITIAGRPPVSNMYETVVWVAFMSAIFALILELIYRKRVIALAGAMVSTLGLVLADQLPLALDPKISPLVPVLRNNYWLTIHVLTIVSSYAGGTLAWGLGNIALALLAFGRPRLDVLKTLSTFTYRAIQIAVLLLATGTFLGGWWAADSWGRFWGWDPKEVWALIALVCYVIPLHARYIGWVKDFGLAVSAVLCYAAIVMSWYGVNFVLGAGLHSYGFGGGGPWWVFWAGLINIEWVLVASMIYLAKKPEVERAAPILAGDVNQDTPPNGVDEGNGVVEPASDAIVAKK
jgi:ABC-type transport system involved in cytochrome c biogenesis permease subunit